MYRCIFMYIYMVRSDAERAAGCPDFAPRSLQRIGSEGRQLSSSASFPAFQLSRSLFGINSLVNPGPFPRLS